MTYQEVEKILRSHDIKPSLLRYKLINYLSTHYTHPTIDMIYKDLKPEIPTLSKTSIYNNLYLFAEKNIVQILKIDEKEIRFDYNTTPHIHFKCEKCGEIYDIHTKIEFHNIKQLEGFTVKQTTLFMKGICAKCNSKGKTN
jgi:Fur family peroxide stress response transcriptional regulator